jgi:uncharacterized membrane protein YhaH (DUF805 family)
MECGGIVNIKEDFFSFKGRVRRSTFGIRWVMFYISFLAIFFACIIIIAISVRIMADLIFLSNIIIISIMLLYLTLMIVQYVKRLHDLDQAGIWVVLIFIPFISLIFFVYLLLADGTVGPNQYGEDPKGRIPYQPYTTQEDMQQYLSDTTQEDTQQYQSDTTQEDMQQYQSDTTQEDMQQY